jgi:hypothetical protein
MQPLHGIAFCLIHLSFRIIEARDWEYYMNVYDLFSISESGNINGIVTGDEYKKWHPTHSGVMDSSQESRLAEYINTMSTEQLVQRIQDRKQLPYMSNLIEYTLRRLDNWQIQKRMVEMGPGSVLPTDCHEKTITEFAGRCGLQNMAWRRKLRDFVDIILQLRKHALTACSSNLLDKNSLRQLKAKMTALQPGFQEACDVLGLPRETLVWDSHTW